MRSTKYAVLSRITQTMRWSLHAGGTSGQHEQALLHTRMEHSSRRARTKNCMKDVRRMHACAPSETNDMDRELRFVLYPFASTSPYEIPILQSFHHVKDDPGLFEGSRGT